MDFFFVLFLVVHDRICYRHLAPWLCVCTVPCVGREIYFSLCGWESWYSPVGASLGNSWRIANDCNLWPSVYNAIRVNQALAANAGVGGWNVRKHSAVVGGHHLSDDFPWGIVCALSCEMSAVVASSVDPASGRQVDICIAVTVTRIRTC